MQKVYLLFAPLNVPSVCPLRLSHFINENRSLWALEASRRQERSSVEKSCACQSVRSIFCVFTVK